MGGYPKTTNKEILKIVSLRERGYTLDEIKRVVNRGKGTIFKYIKSIKPKGGFEKVLKYKKNSSKRRSDEVWLVAKKTIIKKIGKITNRDKILIAGMLYWGEGNKKYELNLINSDSTLVKVFIDGLLEMGVPKEKIKISLRLYGDLDKNKAINYWTNKLKLSKNNVLSINYLDGKKDGKLPYGMCRLRVEKSSLYFKQLMSIIGFVGCRSSMDRTRSS